MKIVSKPNDWKKELEVADRSSRSKINWPSKPPEEKRNSIRKIGRRQVFLALLIGNRLDPVKRAEIVKKLAYFTGLSPDYIERSNLRVVDSRFYKKLLRDQGKTIGRLDARYTGWDRESAGESPDFDQSWSVAIGSYVSLINDYIRRELGPTPK